MNLKLCHHSPLVWRLPDTGTHLVPLAHAPLLFLTCSCSLAHYGCAQCRTRLSLRPGKYRSGRRPLASQPSHARASGASETVPSLAGVGVSEENTDPQRPGLPCQVSGSDAGTQGTQKKAFFLSPLSGNPAWIEAPGQAIVDVEVLKYGLWS